MVIKRVGGEFDFSEYNIYEFQSDRLKDAIAQEIQESCEEILKGAFDEEGTKVFMPAAYGETNGFGGPKCEDPLTIYIQLALGDRDGENHPYWETSLGQVLENHMKRVQDNGPHRAAGLARIRDALRQFADRIDKAITPPPQT